jgi:hypothetical protein
LILIGTMDHYQDTMDAESVVRDVLGVPNVRNTLSVASSPVDDLRELLDQLRRWIGAVILGEEMATRESKGEDQISGDEHRPKPCSPPRLGIPASGPGPAPAYQPANDRKNRGSGQTDEDLQTQRYVIERHSGSKDFCSRNQD